jgi:hypothetical protein
MVAQADQVGRGDLEDPEDPEDPAGQEARGQVGTKGLKELIYTAKGLKLKNMCCQSLR